MDIHTIPQSQSSRQTLHYETGLRALRHCVWIGVYLSQDLKQTGVQCRLTALLVDIDRQLEELS